MGDAGAGKTTFCYHLAQSLWKAHEGGIKKDKPIPILIPLVTIKDVEQGLLKEHFDNRGLSSEELLLLKKSISFVFILEGYDERNVFKNLYKPNNFASWNCKVITSCRSQALLNRPEDYKRYFTTSLLDFKLNEVILCPFTHEEIKKYLHSYVKAHSNEIEWKEERYWEILSQLPSVLALVSNPFVLSMTVLSLPDLVKKYGWGVSTEEEIEIIDEKEEKSLKKEKTLYDQQALTQAELYDGFIDSWFDRQLKKLDTQSKLELKDGTILTKEDFLKFNQEIATEMLTHKTKFLELKQVDKKKESVMSTTSTTSGGEDNWQSHFLNTENEKITLLRSGWLLKKVGDRTYTFLHDSLRAHFAAKQLCHGILSRSSFALGHPLNEQLIVDQLDLLSSLVDRVKKEPSLKELLFELIETSKYEPLVAIGAANAITILNRAKTSFSGFDFRRVRIQGANLSGAFLDRVNFTEADLRDVKFVETSLIGVNFTGACMDNVQFGQLPILRFKNEINSCSYSPDGKWLAVGDDEGVIHLYDAQERIEKTSFMTKKGNAIESLCFSSDSQCVAVGGKDGLCQVWNVTSSKLVCTLKGHTEPGVVVSASALMGKPSPQEATIKPCDSGSSPLAKSCSPSKGILNLVHSVSFSPDGKTLASGSCDQTVRIWELSSGKELLTLKGHTSCD